MPAAEVALHLHDLSLIVGLLLGASGLAWVFFAVRWRQLYLVEKETAATILEGRDAYQRAAERLGAEKDELQQRLAVLEALPHYEELVTILADSFKQMEKRIELHETMAADRHQRILDQGDRTVEALQALTERIER